MLNMTNVTVLMRDDDGQSEGQRQEDKKKDEKKVVFNEQQLQDMCPGLTADEAACQLKAHFKDRAQIFVNEGNSTRECLGVFSDQKRAEEAKNTKPTTPLDGKDPSSVKK